MANLEFLNLGNDMIYTIYNMLIIKENYKYSICIKIK